MTPSHPSFLFHLTGRRFQPGRLPGLAAALLTALLTALLLTACSPTPPTPSDTESPADDPADEPLRGLSTLETYQRAASQAKNNQAWLKYLRYQKAVWQNQEETEKRLETAQATLSTLEALPETTRNALADKHPEAESLQAWLALADLRQGSGSLHRLGLQDFSFFYSDQWFAPQLLPYLQEQLERPRHYAVFLPLSGDYQSVAEQIRNGLLKYQFQAEPPIRLRFYNTSDRQALPSQLQAASEQNVDAILGPVQSDRIEAVLSHWQQHPELARPLLALNELPVEWPTDSPLADSDDSEAPPAIKPFLFPTKSEAEQVAKRLLSAQHRRIGILTNADNRYAQKASAIAGAFKVQARQNVEAMQAERREASVSAKTHTSQGSTEAEVRTSSEPSAENLDSPYLDLTETVAANDRTPAETGPNHSPSLLSNLNLSADATETPAKTVLRTFPERNPNLREALGALINETESQARKNNLRWLLKQPIDFTPRPRQDLDAIVLVTHRTQLAVFLPQFDFFDLTQPVYSTSEAMPSPFQPFEPAPDLAGMRFPAMTAALGQHDAHTAFEAYGWDALTLLHHGDWLQPDRCFHQTATGRIGWDDERYQRHLRWASYDSSGQIQPAQTPAASATPEQPDKSSEETP
ncbi:MAG: penicillin-binding protein activator [Hydrogenovibrio sp.]|uniref:penicillin-binding protein activator n=1 Tax=Hydrogenovibrio sp. TaxID=2065821 RepID=UPI00287016CC|nr:penicillin-binding protein activator [Hydrogenovibrio sp.]MDR9498058.1 penicillin-binding protein activator [Hydrogenovibrio sp.]